MKLPLHNIGNLEKALRQKSERYWMERGEKMALRLFHEMAVRVPAYKKFLKSNGINPKSLDTFKKLERVPPVDKTNYLRAYPLRELCWDGKLSEGQYTISATSGSTGDAFYFPRTDAQDEQYALLAELYLRANFEIHKRKTLYVNAFPMGIWIGGVFTHSAIRKVAERGKYAFSIINPGIQKPEVLKAIKCLGRDFDQIIIGGYGPFVKDILDDGASEGIDWKSYHLGFVFSAEGFTEGFRDQVSKMTGVPFTRTLNHYGTVDLGTMSYETPLAIALRRTALSSLPSLALLLFGEGKRLPTLTQYIPELFFFEERNGNLFCTAESGLPLFRYDLKDRGNVISYEHLLRSYKKLGGELLRDARKAGVSPASCWQLPFVQVFERTDFSVSYYAFQIYPEIIRRGLEHVKVGLITGKFNMESIFDAHARPKLVIRVELRPDTKGTKKLRDDIRLALGKQLLKESSEFRETYKEKGERIYPKITLLPYEDPARFKPGTKQKWVVK